MCLIRNAYRTASRIGNIGTLLLRKYHRTEQALANSHPIFFSSTIKTFKHGTPESS